MNVADSDRLARALGTLGLEETTDASQAGMIILNTVLSGRAPKTAPLVA